MRILVSACLLGKCCKYNGGSNYTDKIEKYKEGNEIVSFCPEVLSGLPIPRTPIEYVNNDLIDNTGKSYYENLCLGRKCVEKILENNFDLAILKARSPSCGRDFIYDGTFTKTIVNKDGFACEIIKKHNIKIMTEEEL